MIIDFDKKLYSLKAVKSAAKKYRHLADFDLRPASAKAPAYAEPACRPGRASAGRSAGKQKKEKFLRVKLKDIDKSISKVIKDEFCNYVLYLMKS